jgi:hypothetical protein
METAAKTMDAAEATAETAAAEAMKTTTETVEAAMKTAAATHPATAVHSTAAATPRGIRWCGQRQRCHRGRNRQRAQSFPQVHHLEPPSIVRPSRRPRSKACGCIIYDVCGRSAIRAPGQFFAKAGYPSTAKA